jgi:hypothetical protein
MDSYIFDPLAFGFKPLADFPRLGNAGAREWFGNPDNVFIKVLAVGGPEFGRDVYWYCACKIRSGLTPDDRIEIYNHAFDEAEAADAFTKSTPTCCYRGLIATNGFATLLLCHLFGTLDNESVEKYGRKRLGQDLSKKIKNP